MANFNYRPDQREFYDVPDEYGNMSMIVGGGLKTAGEGNVEDQYNYASEANYRAFAASRLPYEASSDEVIQKAIELLPQLKVPKEKQDERRRMSEQARNAILDAAVRRVFALQGRHMEDRECAALMYRGTSADIVALNDEQQRQLENGTPADRGRLLVQRINECMELYNRIINGQVSDQELIDNFEQMHIVQDLVMNAQNFRNRAVPDKITGKIDFEISDDTIAILRQMEAHSNEVAAFVDKVRLIANPNFEFLDLDLLTNERRSVIDELSDNISDALDEVDRTLNDVFDITNEIKGMKDNILVDNMLYQVAIDFPAEHEEAIVQFAGSDGELKSVKCVRNSFDSTIQMFMEEGYALVTTPSGDAACYHVDKFGHFEIANSSEMLNYTASDTEHMLKMMKNANKGFFIGSREYSSALKNMQKAFTTVQKLGNPPSLEKIDKAASYYMAVLEEAEKYIEKKLSRPPTPDEQAILDQVKNPADRVLTENDIRNAMSPRERLRFDTMKQAATFCKKQLSLLTLQSDAVSAEKKAVMDFHRINEAVPYPNVNELEVSMKTHHTYGKEFSDWNNGMQTVNNEIPASNMGVIADDLRANIENRLDTMGYECDPKEARNVMSDMVVLELVKLERKQDDQGNIIAGDIETKLAEDPGDTLTFFRNDPYIKAMTQNVTIEKLRNFIMNDGAKTMANRIMKVIEQSKAAALENKNAPDVKEMAGDMEKAPAQDGVNAQNNQQEPQIEKKNEMQGPVRH